MSIMGLLSTIRVLGTIKAGTILKSFSLQFLTSMERSFLNIWIENRRIWTVARDKKHLLKLTSFSELNQEKTISLKYSLPCLLSIFTHLYIGRIYPERTNHRVSERLQCLSKDSALFRL